MHQLVAQLRLKSCTSKSKIGKLFAILFVLLQLFVCRPWSNLKRVLNH